MPTAEFALPHERAASRTTELLLVVMAVIWGVNFSVVKYGTQVMEPLAYNALRMAIGCAVLMVFALWRPGMRASTRDRLQLMALGVLGHCLYQVLFINGIARTRAGTASLVVAASPAVVALVARAYGHEKLPLRAVVGIALSITGVVLVLGGTISADGASHLVGDLMILAAVVAWAFYTTLLLPFTKRVDALRLAAWTLLGGVLPLVVIASPALWRTDWGAVTPLTWSAVLYSGLMAMVVAYLLWYRGVKEIGATRTAMFGNLQPIVALLVAWIALAEVPTAFQGAGAATVLGGLYLSRR
ncbi:MAG: DMT family transporter [Gemmatimonadales bacterium]|nr:DMT family transporter [Gemmatimonadales bacterium]